MRRMVGLIAGAIIGALLTGICLCATISLWPREVRPIGTPQVDTPAALTPRSSGPSLPAITRLSLQSPYEAQGLDFQRVQLADDRERWVAASPDGLALVEIVGADTVEQATVTVFGPIRPGEDIGTKRAIYMLTMMNTILPGWTAGAEWFSRELTLAANQSEAYTSDITEAGVRVVFSFDEQLGAFTLSFEPE